MQLKRTKQCAKCPWRKDVDPFDIPDGYSLDKHKALVCTIAKQNEIPDINGPLQAMACHETQDAHCLGWLMNQLGEGNNIRLRIAMMKCENMDEIQLVGPQHESFEETLPETTQPRKRRASSSGVLYLRATPHLVRMIRAAAKNDKVSVNTWCVKALNKVIQRKGLGSEQE